MVPAEAKLTFQAISSRGKRGKRGTELRPCCGVRQGGTKSPYAYNCLAQRCLNTFDSLCDLNEKLKDFKIPFKIPSEESESGELSYNTNIGPRQVGFRDGKWCQNGDYCLKLIHQWCRKQHNLLSKTRRNRITLRLKLSGPTMPEHFRFTLWSERKIEGFQTPL